jgi:DNA-binding transcriptional ArsR family regulator
MSEKEVLDKYFKLIMEKLETQEKIIRSLEERVSRIERLSSKTSETSASLPISLIKVLRVLDGEGRPLGTEDIAKKLNLSRNLTSNYLKRLTELGYVIKEPNLEGYGSRYLFRVNVASVPENVRKLYLSGSEKRDG